MLCLYFAASGKQFKKITRNFSKVSVNFDESLFLEWSFGESRKASYGVDLGGGEVLRKAGKYVNFVMSFF